MSEQIQSPWKILPSEEGIAFEAVFQLPNDGTSMNALVVWVGMDDATSESCTVRLLTRTFKDTVICTFDTSVSALGNLLYGFATVKHIPQLVFK